MYLHKNVLLDSIKNLSYYLLFIFHHGKDFSSHATNYNYGYEKYGRSEVY